MAKLKAAGSKKKPATSNLRAIPCLILIVGGVALLSLLFYAMLSAGK